MSHPKPTNARTNRLAREASPYLVQHAKNPVDWYPWGDEALSRARAEDKPILLSIGYSACHWCHVMERECFEDEVIARQMNDGYVCIKVDREERPDLDQIYQLVVQLMGRSGGWPLTVFLTPDQRPFFGGTYFPPVDKYGVPGFPKILEAVREAYTSRRGEVTAQASELTDAIARVTEVEVSADAGGQLRQDLLGRTADVLSARFDDQHGGFGRRPKFPSTMALDVLLRRGVLEKDERALGRVRFALDRMRAGGIYDQLGGGFHRYSTDEKWLVPHFEKMLYDNALFLRLYVDGWRTMGEERFADTARAIAAYVSREMTAPEGGFYATQDADSEGVEGKFFVWTPAEVRRALAMDDEAATVACLRWGITDEGNFEETHATVLHEAKTSLALSIQLNVSQLIVEPAIERARKRMFDAREMRPKPFRDEKILASWNGLMIGAMADAGAALGDPALVRTAERAFAFVERALVVRTEKSTRVMRHVKDGIVKGPGFLDDYAFLADAALDLFEATGESGYVLRARALTDAILARFPDPKSPGFFFTPSDHEALIHRTKDPHDQAIPSGSSIACKVLLRLGAIADEYYGDVARRVLEAIAPAALENPFGFGQTLGVMDRLVRGSVDVVLVGAREDPRTQALARAASEMYLPNRNLVWLTGHASRAACAAIAEGKIAGDEPLAYVCRGQTCSLPIASPGALRALLE